MRLLQHCCNIWGRCLTLFLAIRWRRTPNVWESSSVVLALIGTFLLVTDGKWHGLSVPTVSVAWLLVGFVVVFGTLLAFYLYLSSLRYISPSETSVLVCAEPLSAAIVAIVFLYVHIGAATLLGGLCIVTMVIIWHWLEQEQERLKWTIEIDRASFESLNQSRRIKLSTVPLGDER